MGGHTAFNSCTSRRRENFWKLWLFDCENVEMGRNLMKICKILQKREHFLEILGKQSLNI